MPGGRYEHEQLPFIFREAAAPTLTSALVTLPQGFQDWLACSPSRYFKVSHHAEFTLTVFSNRKTFQ